MPVRSLAFCLLVALLLSGCAATRLFKKPASPPLTAENALHAALDRYDQWISMSANAKLRLKVQDEKMTARGHVMYLAGERYEIGFQKPYNRMLGTFYVTPTQLVYFDVHAFPKTFNLKDTVGLADLIPLALPNWDPRDVLPFPVSGRTTGFQTDSITTESGRFWVYGTSDNVSYALTLDPKSGAVTQELVQRAGRDLVMKNYRHIKTLHGWPVATQVSCTDQTGHVTFTWSLSGIQLRAREFRVPTESLSPSK